MSKALNRISQSPFTRKIKGAELPWRFHQPTFAIYNGRTDPVEHVSQFNQRMAVHSKDEALIAWDAFEALGVDLDFICHHLNVNPSVTPKKQPPWRPSKEQANAVREEVMKLKKAGAIKEVFYPEWLANTVVVKKKSGKWQVCVDFTNLNKACPKDPFPMPRIDRLVDHRTSSNELPRCLSRISSNTPDCRRPRKNSFCHPHRKLPL